MWEDEANKNGARWIFRIKKGSVNLFWEELIFSTRIKNKLHGNKSGFQYLLRKYYDISDLLDFTESKNVLKDEQITLIGVRGGTNQLFIYNTRLRN